MKKFLYALAAVILLVSACGDKTPAEIRDDRVYFFFSNSCPHCHHALDYINKNYPDAPITMVNVGNNSGYRLFLKCAEKFKLGNRLGTPLFCMGNRYIMGWAPEYEKKFDRYIKPFLK